MPPVLIVLSAVAVIFGGAYLGARRFEARKRKQGEWDVDGPLNPSVPEASHGGPYALAYGGLKRAWERFHGFEYTVSAGPVTSEADSETTDNRPRGQ